MTLRSRLLFTSLAVALPLAGALFLIDQRLRMNDMKDRLNGFAQAELSSNVLARCISRDGLIGRPAPQPDGQGRAQQGPPQGGQGQRQQSPPPPPPQGGRGDRPEPRPDPPPHNDGRGPGGRADQPPPADGRAQLAGDDQRTAPPPPTDGSGQRPPRNDQPPLRGGGRGPRSEPRPDPPPRNDGNPANAAQDNADPQNGNGRGGTRPPPPPPRQRPTQSPYDVFSYRPDGIPSTPNAPVLSAALLAGLAAGEASTETYQSPEGTGLRMAVWMSRDAGPCSVLLLQVPARPGERRDQIAGLALITFSAMGAAWIAAGPVMSRMRRLTAAVHVSADTHYDTPVPVTGNDEVAILATAFNDAGGRVREYLLELQQREDGLRQFVANTAHDVGLPLTVLQGHLAALDAIAESDGAPDLKVQGSEGSTVGVPGLQARGSYDSADRATADRDMAARTSVRAAMNEAHYLGSLIRNLSAATRLDAVGTPLDTHPVDLNALVERVVSRHSVVARARSVELNYAVPETAISTRAEVTLLEQAVGNLVDNAIRHNRAGGHVAIVLDQFESTFKIAVTDDGPGVKEADLARLTERWFRADEARTRRPDGQGLGLAIASESIKRLGFTLKFFRPAEGGLAAEIAGSL